MAHPSVDTSDSVTAILRESQLVALESGLDTVVTLLYALAALVALTVVLAALAVVAVIWQRASQARAAKNLPAPEQPQPVPLDRQILDKLEADRKSMLEELSEVVHKRADQTEQCVSERADQTEQRVTALAMEVNLLAASQDALRGELRREIRVVDEKAEEAQRTQHTAVRALAATPGASVV